jgi:hypothetical protein
VLLLVVLSLLVLFALIGITFVLVASQSRRISRADSRGEQYGDDYRKQLDEVFAQVVRDTTNTQSVLRTHSLLNDMYGLDGMKLYYTTVTSLTAVGGQFIDLTFDGTNPNNGNPFLTTPPVLTASQLQTPGFFNGCVLTMVDGPAANLSTRIVGWSFPPGTTITIRIMALDGFPAANLTQSGYVLVNGRPFNGTGFGLQTNLNFAKVGLAAIAPGSTGSVTLADNITVVTAKNQTTITLNSGDLAMAYQDPITLTNWYLVSTMVGAADTNGYPYALMPNPKYFLANPPYNIFGGVGGADEDYDAADPQNMLLGYMPVAVSGAPINPLQIFPSLHRWDLVSYWQNRGTVWNNDLARKVVLRPLPADHPNFTGSNPSFDPAGGPWDVDNDGDGNADSIWVDVGLPVQTAPDGRRFKPLAAILCLDLDGRLNVNAHGNVVQTDQFFNGTIPLGTLGVSTLADYAFNTTPAPVTLAQGSGYGPAEINLLSAFATTTPKVDYQNFFKGLSVGSKIYPGRYGEYTAGGTTLPLPGVTVAATSADDRLDLIKRFDFSPNYNYYTSAPSNYGSPSDLWGRGVVAVDYAGQPIYSFLSSLPPNTTTPTYALGVAASETPNDPYAFNLARNRIRSADSTAAISDNPFMASELERILRKYDIDVSALPDRLRTLLDPRSDNTNDLARMVTTDSYDLPSPSVLPTKDIAALLKTQNGGLLPTGLSIVDLLRAKMLAGGCSAATINAQIATMLPPELIAGQRFDLNRPFGNGQDDDTTPNGVVDEPTEFNAKKELPANWTTGFGTSAPTGLDLNNDGVINGNDLYARQLYAKHLYILMMLLSDQTYAWAQDNGASVGAAQKELNARRIAQWAINVVDFRDADSIMTPFEYDSDPFDSDGWNVDGILGTVDDNDPTGHPDRRLVWGCEKPELLLTETLALHDRRVSDTSAGPGKIAGTPPDPDMDQARIPQGSLFLELYCPHNGNATVPNSYVGYPGDLFNNNGTQWGLDLGKMADPQHPVWRIAITQSRIDATSGTANDVPTRIGKHPDLANFDPVTTGYNGLLHGSLFDSASAEGAIQIDRLVWFSYSATDPSTFPDNVNLSVYYNKSNTTSTPTLLAAGRYAVVGPRATTYVGLAGPLTNAQQKIALDTAAGTVNYTPANNLNTLNWTAPTYPALPIICVGTPTGLSIDVGVSISEPNLFTYYSQIPTGTGPGGLVDTYSPNALDTPLDSPLKSPLSPIGKDNLQATKLNLLYKTALLQRLANPLLAYNAATNPYLTVDWQPIDLMVFNGEEPPPSSKPDPADLTPTPVPVGSRERGSSVTPVDLWNLNPQTGTTTLSAKGATAVFDYNIIQTLGYLNTAIGAAWTSPPAAQATYAGAPSPTPGYTFPWITWNNRPFTSSTELLQVPATSAEQLLRQFSTYSLPASTSPFVGNANATSTLGAQFLPSPFTYQLNFNSSADGNPGNAPYFYRLLEYVHVPSRFVGTETWLNPANFSSPLPTATGQTEQDLASFFHPPFNKVSNYRDPGRVNINTIPSDTSAASAIWSGINGLQAPLWGKIALSRNGGAAPGVSSTLIANPFRTAGGAAYTLPGTPAIANEVSATLMRPDPANPLAPLFGPTGAAQPYTNPDRNPYFRYQSLAQLSNLLTTRSNVYAIWITVGYFEVSAVGVDVAHPDGYALGQELGSDSGDIKRHRAFYIFDRSIPVGFEPGRDHNIDKGVLLKRFIE